MLKPTLPVIAWEPKTTGEYHMHEQTYFINPPINVHELLNDLEYIDNQMKAIKSDLSYVSRLVEAFDRELRRAKEEALRGELCLR